MLSQEFLPVLVGIGVLTIKGREGKGTIEFRDGPVFVECGVFVSKLRLFCLGQGLTVIITKTSYLFSQSSIINRYRMTRIHPI